MPNVTNVKKIMVIKIVGVSGVRNLFNIKTNEISESKPAINHIMEMIPRIMDDSHFGKCAKSRSGKSFPGIVWKKRMNPNKIMNPKNTDRTIARSEPCSFKLSKIL
jgi:hypothetical protein